MKWLKIDFQSRVYGLDIFRAVAILLVVIGHGGLVSGDIFSAIPSIPVVDGVDLFFVLSGFLIGSILIREIEKEEKFTLSKLLHFWKRRWFRTLPNYYLILLVNIALVSTGVIGGDINQFSFKFFLFLQNFQEGFYGFFWESWSLSIEEWFYISLPLFLYLALKYVDRRSAFLFSCVFLIVLSIAYRVYRADLQVDGFWLDVHFRKVVLTRLDAILYGVLAAYVKFHFPKRFYKYRNTLFVLGLIIIYTNILLPKEPNDFYTKAISFSVTSIGAALLLAKADSIKDFKFAFTGKAITFISVISYSMYLVNLALVAQVIKHNVQMETTTQHVLWYLVYWVATIALSATLYFLYERPMTNLRDRF